MHHVLSTGLTTGVLLVGFVPAASAVTATFQVEGQTKVVAPRSVQTPATVSKDGTNSCPGTTSIGVLEAGSAGDWSGSYSYGSYTAETILGEQHMFGSGAFWAIYKNGRFQNSGACQIAVADGDEILFYWSDDPYAAGVGGYDEPLVLSDVPATVKPGVPFSVTVQEARTTFDPTTYEGTTGFAPAQGATVGGATVGADGKASITPTQRGALELKAVKGNRAPDRAATCVSDGVDGFCGTVAATAAAPPVPDACPTQTRAAYGFIRNIAEQQRFTRAAAPRELRGDVDREWCGIEQVRLRLTRNDRGDCSTFDAAAARFTALRRCGAGRGRWFEAGDRDAWSYLLPQAPGRGRYVLDVEVANRAGRRDTTLHRGRNRIVFHVA